MFDATPFLFARNRLALLAVMALLALGLAIRLYDLTDLPLDFHATRQLLSELKARGMYYQGSSAIPDWQRRMAVQQWKSRAEVEPEVLEALVAFTYRFMGVQPWVARVYSSIFWVAGAFFLFLLVRHLVSPDGAVAAVGYFLFLPFAVIASRSFQPDVLMIMLVICFWWMVLRWADTESWIWAILAGLVGGLAIYVKFVAAFFVIGAALGAALGAFGARLMRKPQIWVMSALGILPASIYIYYGVVQQGFLGRQFSGRFIPALLVSPLNYLQWATLANSAAGGLGIALGLLGLLVTRDRRARFFVASLWISYVVFGLFFDYHVATHDYYHLPLIALVAISLAPLASFAMSSVARSTRSPLAQGAVYGILLYAVLSAGWEAHSELKAVDFRPEATMWAQLGDRLGHGPNVVALTQDYGSRLAYWGWQNANIWPNSGDVDYHEARGASIGFDGLFSRLTTGNKYFAVTDFAELQRQPQLKAALAGFTVYAQGDGYIIYDLQDPVTQ
jgi:hypothetical protein